MALGVPLASSPSSGRSGTWSPAALGLTNGAVNGVSTGVASSHDLIGGCTPEEDDGALADILIFLQYNKMVNGVTPLMAARDANSTECIKLLVKVQEEPMLKREIVASELISLGNISLKKKDYAIAAKLYSRAMQLDPDDAVLFSDRSLCWLHMGDGRKALLDANKCRKMRPHWPKACRQQGLRGCK
ncbi:uncharacterized protein LOC119350097 [Triticum dicoccoides]|uniref:uncharacterized protein LOC119350097 n=1 Tax=Triticum dicoccoides TaxID=85692 RepID=UPI00188DD16C|nr:uncharacterized protein LOC119350097 [Triticum dicoccoides]